MLKKILSAAIILSALLIIIAPSNVFGASATSTPPATERVCQEVPLPRLPGLPDDPCSSPAAYIQYWFYFAIYLAGIAALLTFVAGGILYMLSAATGEVKKGSKWMVNAALGLILLFGSFILLRTLGGEQLTTLKNPKLPNLPSCFITFDPSPVNTGEQTKIYWQAKTKNAYKISNALCINPDKSEHTIKSTSLEGTDIYIPTAPGNAKCGFSVEDADGKIIETCSSTVRIVDFYCSLKHKDTIGKDELYFKVNKNAEKGILSCQSNTIINRDAFNEELFPCINNNKTCTLIPPIPRYNYVNITDAFSDTCTLQIELPGGKKGSCYANIQKSQEKTPSDDCELEYVDRLGVRHDEIYYTIKPPLPNITSAIISCSTTIDEPDDNCNEVTPCDITKRIKERGYMYVNINNGDCGGTCTLNLSGSTPMSPCSVRWKASTGC